MSGLQKSSSLDMPLELLIFLTCTKLDQTIITELNHAIGAAWIVSQERRAIVEIKILLEKRPMQKFKTVPDQPDKYYIGDDCILIMRTIFQTCLTSIANLSKDLHQEHLSTRE